MSARKMEERSRRVVWVPPDGSEGPKAPRPGAGVQWMRQRASATSTFARGLPIGVSFLPFCRWLQTRNRDLVDPGAGTKQASGDLGLDRESVHPVRKAPGTFASFRTFWQVIKIGQPCVCTDVRGASANGLVADRRTRSCRRNAPWKPRTP